MYAKDRNMEYHECSAKTADGVQQAFTELTKKLMEKR